MNREKHAFWRIMQQYSVYVVKLVVQIVLARLLTPDEFGVLAIVMVFSSIAEIVAVSGLDTALVQKLKPDKLDYSTVFSFSIIAAAIVYSLIALCAPLISDLYHNADLTVIVRVYGISVFFQVYLAVINAYVQKNYLFKKSFEGNLISVVFAGLVAVLMAYNGAGVWALVLNNLLYAIFSIIIIQILIQWYPGIAFCKERFKPLFSFSWKVLISSLIGALLENLYDLTIGKKYGEASLGYYKQGNAYPHAILGQTRIAFGAIILPIYSSFQYDNLKLRDSVGKMTHIITAVIFPMAFGLAAVAETFVRVILTDKWLPAVYFLRLECVFFGALAITTSLENGMIAKGRSDIIAKLEFSKLIATLICILTCSSFGIKVLCAARVTVAVMFIFISAACAHRVLQLPYSELLKSVGKPFIFSAIMGVLVYAVSNLKMNNILLFASELFVGGCVYGVLCYFFMKDDIHYLKSIFGCQGDGSE